MTFEPNQPVEIRFNHGAAGAFTLNGRVIENIDSVCRPLTDMWSVEVTEGRECGARFGISGKALAPRTEEG